MKFQLYVIKGKENSGKTTTCWKILNLFRTQSLIDSFCYWKTSNSSELHYEESDRTYRIGSAHADFTTIFTGKVNDKRKNVAIISAGDDANLLKRRIFDMLGEGVEYIVCCERSVERNGSTMEMLHSEFYENIKYENTLTESRDSSCEEIIAKEILSTLLENIIIQ